MTPAEFRAQVRAAGPYQGHPFTPSGCVAGFADLDGRRTCLVHGGDVNPDRPFDGCGA